MNGNAIVSLTISVADGLSGPTSVMAAGVEKLSNGFRRLIDVAQGVAEKIFAIANGFVSFLSSAESASAVLSQFQQSLKGVGVDIDQMLDSLGDFKATSLTETLGSLDAPLRGLISGAIPQTGAALSQISTTARGFGESIAYSVNLADKAFIALIEKAERIPQRLQAVTGGIGDIFGYLSGVREPLEVFEQIRTSVVQTSSAIFSLVQEIGLFGLGVQALGQLVNSGPFAALIGQNIELQQQLLGTQSALAATNRVFRNGIQVTDATDAIVSLTGPVEEAIKRLEQGSRELSNVTSRDLVPVFSIVASEAGNIGTSLNGATDLALSFSAAMGTLNIPLFQANQEIRSILNGQIDQNSRLAQNLNLNSAMVNQWRSQGRLVEELTKKLEPLREGNKLAADSVGNLGSNIKDIFEIIQRTAGAPLLEPIVGQLKRVYNFLNNNQTQLTAYIGTLAKYGETTVLALVKAAESIGKVVAPIAQQIPIYLFKSLTNAAVSLGSAIENTLIILQPAINAFALLAQAAVAASGPFLQMYLQFKALQVGVGLLSNSFGILFKIIPGVGDLLFLMTGRGNALVSMFSQLSTQLGVGSAGFLLLGKNLASVPFAFNQIAKSIPIIGPAIAALIPQISTLAIGFTQLANRFPIVSKGFDTILKSAPGLLDQLAVMASNRGFPAVGAAIADLATQTNKYGSAAKVATAINAQFIQLAETTGAAIRNQVIKFAALAAGVAVAGVAINELVIKNKALIEILKSFGGFLQGLGELIYSALANPLTYLVGGITALSVAITAKLLPSLALMRIAMIDGLVSGIGAVLPAILSYAKVIEGIGFSQAALGATKVALALETLAAGAAAGTLTVSGLATSLKALAVGAAAALAPLALVVGGVVAIGYAYQQSLKNVEQGAIAPLLRDASQALKESVGVEKLVEEARTRSNAAREKGIALTAEEIRLNQEAAKQAQKQVGILDGEIATLRLERENAKGDEAKKRLEQQITVLEQRRDKLQLADVQGNLEKVTRQLAFAKKDLVNITDEKRRKVAEQDIQDLENQKNKLEAATAEEIVLKPIKLPEFGDLRKLLADRAKAAEAAIDNPFGDPQIFKNQVDKLVSDTQIALETGAIDLNEAIRRFRKVAGSTALSDPGDRIKALQQLTAAIQKEAEIQVGTIDATTKEQEALVASGRESQENIQDDLTENALEQTKIRINAVNEQIKAEADLGREGGENYRKLVDQRRVLQADLIRIEEEGLRKIYELRIQNFEQERTINAALATQGKLTREALRAADYQSVVDQTNVEITEAERRRSLLQQGDTEGQRNIDEMVARSNLKRADAQKQFLDFQGRLLGESLEKLNDVIAQSNADFEATLTEQIAAGNISENQAALERVEIVRRETATKLEAQKAYLQQLASLPKPDDPDAAKEAEDRIRKAKLETAKLTADLASKELDRQKALQQVISDQIDKRTKQSLNAINAETREYEKQLTLLDKMNGVLNNQKRILDGRASLQKGIAGFIDGEYRILIDTAKSEEERNRLTREAAKAKLIFLRQEQEFKRASLELEIQQQRLTDARAIRDNQRQQIQAGGEVRQAEANLEKLQRDPRAKKEDIDAARGDLEGRRFKVEDLQAEQLLLFQGQAITRQQERMKRGELQLSQRLERDQARLEYGKTLPKEQQEEYIDRLRGISQRAIRGARKAFGEESGSIRVLPPRITQSPLTPDLYRLVNEKIDLKLFGDRMGTITDTAGNISKQLQSLSAQLLAKAATVPTNNTNISIDARARNELKRALNL